MTTQREAEHAMAAGPVSGTARQYDVAVIGGGAVGLASALALVSAYRLSLVVVEAEDKIAAHQTGNNSGVIHSGLYYKPGSLKAKLCTEGREAMYRFCQEQGIRHEKCGKVVVALNASELPALDELQRRGEANGLTGLRRLTIEEVREREPHVAGIAGMVVAETGIVDYKQVTRRYAELVRQLGGDVVTGAQVRGVSRRGDGLTLHTRAGDIACRGLVNCGGLHSDRIARMCGLEPEVQIVPFRGEYYKLTEAARHLCKNLIYPVPNPAFPFLGVHFTRMVEGGVEAGPNAVLALARHGYTWGDISPRDLAGTLTFPGFWRMAAKFWRVGCGEMHRSLSKQAFLKALQRLMPELRSEHLEPGGAGVRAQAMEKSGKLVDDFRIMSAERMVHVLNAPSPACTASISIGRHIAEKAGESLGLAGRRESVHGVSMHVAAPAGAAH
jgi:L-2-hydroxyglutarate oxidase